MQVTVHRNLAALRFIRCLAPIQGSSVLAGGAGWSLQQALIRCESEVIERAYELHELIPAGIRPMGIAAHLALEPARERAVQESVETLCLRQIHSEQRMRCAYRFKLGQFSLGVARTTHGYFALIRGYLDLQPVAAHSAGPSLLGTLLKAWEEYQSLQFFQPEGARLKTFTRANHLFSEIQLRDLPFQTEPRYIYRPELSRLSEAATERSGRVIVYYFERGDSP